MNNKNKKVRDKLKSINTYKTFYQIIDGVILSDEEKRILEMFYLEEKTFGFIADELKISTATISRRHKKILDKLIDSI